MSDLDILNYRNQFNKDENENHEITVNSFSHSVTCVNPKYVKWLEQRLANGVNVNNNTKALRLQRVSSLLPTTLLEESDEGFMVCKITTCCKRGPITDEKYCGYCGALIVRKQ